MTISTDDPKPVKNRGLIQVGVLLGVIALYFAGSWAKERFIDPDRTLLSVHALGSQEAVIMIRYDQGDNLLWRIEKVRMGSDEPLWGHNIPFPPAARARDGISVSGGHVVFLDEAEQGRVSVTALDLDTGDVTWKRDLQTSGRSTPEIVGAARYVLIDGRDNLHVLDRKTGKTLYSREGFTQNLDFAFTETWIELLEVMGIEYLDIQTGRRHSIEDTRGAHCRVDGHVYGFNGKRTLRAHNLATGEVAEVITPETKHKDFHPASCGWRRNADGSLRLLFAHESPGELLAIDLDPASPAGSGRVAWTRTFSSYLEIGDISYQIPNRLDLVWSGEVPRFAPLEVDVPTDTEDRSAQIVVVDTTDGTLSRQGPPGDHIANRYVSFKRGKTVYMVLEGWRDDRPGTVLAMDTRTAEAHAVSSPGEFRVAPPSVTDSVAWAWTERSASRQNDLAISVLGEQLRLQESRDPSRAPTADEDFVTSLLGAAPK